ncbi:MAG: efflux RND transporter permease subunit [Armatimonadota bacterium]|nr:efflux RND transporter permease subunit [Armatimonadota bacterium]
MMQDHDSPTTKPRIETRAPTALHMIHKWSIEHPYVIISFYLSVVIMAVLAVGFYTPRRFMPYVESPMIGVVSMMPGLSAQEMEMYISKPIEESLVNVKNLHYIRSTSQDGFSIVSLEFNYGTDMKKALFDVQSLMNVIQANLPATGANLKPSWVLAIDPLNLPILSIAVTGDSRWDNMRLREFVDNDVVNRIKSIPAVYSVVPFGGYKRQLQIIVDRDKLAAYKLSILDVRNAIDRYNVTRSGGRLTNGSNEIIVRVDTRAVNANTVLNYPIASITASGTVAVSAPASGGMGGVSSMDGANSISSPTNIDGVGVGTLQQPRTVYVRDVAKVVDTHWERRSAYHYMNHGKVKEAIEAAVIQDAGASSAKVVPAVRKVLKQLEAENPGVKFEVAYDNARFVNILFKNMFEELLIAILLTAIAVLLFLGEWRGTLISLITIPISLAMAMLGLTAMGMTLNSGTLIGLLLSIGRLVDDSIIDIHAVERHMRMGKDPKTATIDGIAEVRLAVIASTIMLVLALSPLLFSGGIVQLMFVELVWPIILGLLASMLVSFTLTALLCANLLRPHSELEGERSRWLYRRILGPVQGLLDRMETGYANIIRWMLQHRFSNMARILATVIIGFTFYNFIGSEMMPLADVGQAYGVLEMAPGTSFAETERATKALEKIIAKYPEIEKVSAEIGAESLFESFSPFYTGYAMPQANAATMMITFSDKDDRKRDIWQIVDAIHHEATLTIPGIRRLQIKEMGSDVMASSLAPVSVVLYGKDMNVLNQIGQETLRVAKETPGLYQVASSWDMAQPSYKIDVIPERAQALGLTPEDISQQAYYSLAGGLTSEWYRVPNIRQNTVLVRYEDADRKTSNDLSNMYITATDGRQVPLKSVANIAYENAPTVIEHDSVRRVISINGYYRKDGHLGRSNKASMDVTMDLMMKAMSEVNFPPGYGIEARGDMTQMMDSFRRLLIGLQLAIIFIFLVLVAQFRGFLQPLQMVFSLPLELSGVFLALFLAHQAFSTVSIMAVLVLTGMDITTAILLIDMVARYRDRGVPRDQAVIEACPQRLRPILMTSMITMIVMAPVALFPKTGMDAYQPLGTVILGGLLIGTILSLFDIPIMHTYVDDFIRWVNKRFLKRDWEWPVIAKFGEGEYNGLVTEKEDHV